MQDVIHAVGIGFQRLALAAGLAAVGAIVLYVLLVFALVVIQAGAAFGQ